MRYLSWIRLLSWLFVVGRPGLDPGTLGSNNWDI
jgi:hypothetical protein